MGADAAWRVTGFVLRSFLMIWTFAFGKSYSRGALRLLVVFILIGTRAVLITKVSSGVNIFARWVFKFCLFLDFSYGISVLNVKSCWGGVEYDMI